MEKAEKIEMVPAGDDDVEYIIIQASTLEYMLRQANYCYDKFGAESLIGPVIADLEIALSGQRLTPN